MESGREGKGPPPHSIRTRISLSFKRAFRRIESIFSLYYDFSDSHWIFKVGGYLASLLLIVVVASSLKLLIFTSV